MLLTFGLAMVIEQGLRIVFGASPLPFSIPPELRGQVFVGDFIYPRYRLVILGVAVGAVVATWFIVYRTAFGRVVRAGGRTPMSSVRSASRLRPYHGNCRARRGACRPCRRAACADLRRPPGDGRGDPHRRFRCGRHRGPGSFWGVIMAAMLVGVVRGVTIYFNPSWGEASMYFVMALVLLLRPRGLLGERIEKFE